MADTPFTRAEVGAVLPCTDFGRCVAFYRDTLGFKVEESQGMPGNATVFGGRGSVFNLYERAEATRAEHTAAGILVDDFDEAISHLRSKGVKLEDIDQPGLRTEDGIATIGEFRGAWFKDSEGNIIAVMPAAAMAGLRRAA